MRLAVVGTGLIGCSFALAARRAEVFDHVVGIEPDRPQGERAVTLGIVDALADAVPDTADAVLLAGPSHTIAPWAQRLADHRGVVFDAGSVKGALLTELRAGAGVPPRFVPCHPMAGSERSGPDAAGAGLFEQAEVILTPGPECDAAAVAAVRGWWEACGARVTTMDAATHDRLLAVTSHLPHLLAFAYLHQITDEHLPHTAGGYRDFTRIGAADADMWAPIFRLNRDALLAALDDLEATLRRARQLLAQDDPAALIEFIRAAAARRSGDGRRESLPGPGDAGGD
ncbi:MAG: prephenate dehydrogenase/arogenate dehydrogenase family protein [Gammaproteobacteria bacterium]|jgi:prephenate dehydrogenase|nr:prephenate dehydrogenase/arogenate dehydrogenase family protein [Gammaproteobacteria bacterium]